MYQIHIVLTVLCKILNLKFLHVSLKKSLNEFCPEIMTECQIIFEVVVNTLELFCTKHIRQCSQHC